MIFPDLKIFALSFVEKRLEGATWYNLEVALSRAGLGGEVNALELMTLLVSEKMLSVSDSDIEAFPLYRLTEDGRRFLKEHCSKSG